LLIHLFDLFEYVQPRDQEGYRYDAYISFVDKEPGTTWVWEALVPRLEAIGLRVAVSGDSGDPSGGYQKCSGPRPCGPSGRGALEIWVNTSIP
jgi:hypothetical protein